METVFIIISVGIAMAFIQRLSQRPAIPSKDGGSLVLKHSWFYTGFGWLALMIGIGVSCIPLLIKIKPDDHWPIIGLVTLFGGLGAVIINDARGRVWLMHDRVEAFSPWRGKHTLKWADVTSVKYSTVNRWFVLKSSAAETIRISTMYVGVPTLVELLRTNIASEVYAEALKGYNLQSK